MAATRRLFALVLMLLLCLPPSPSAGPAGSSVPGQSSSRVAPPGPSDVQDAARRVLLAEALADPLEREAVRTEEAVLDQLDAEAARLWSRLLAALPAPSLPAAEIAREGRLRTAVLPLLAGRRAAYRALEVDAEQRLRTQRPDPAAAPVGEATAQAAARVSALRDWAEATAAIEQEARGSLGTLHTLSLLRWGRALGTLPPTLRTELSELTVRRQRAQAQHEAARAVSETRRDARREAARNRELQAAREIAERAAAVERLADELVDPTRRQARRDPAHERLADAVASQARGAASRAAGWAAERAGVSWLGHDSFLSPPSAPPADPDLAPIARERTRIAHELLASLERRVEAIDDLRRLVRERDALLTRARATLSSGATVSTPIDGEALDRLGVVARTRWANVDALVPLVGPLSQASLSRERAAAAEFLGRELEPLVAGEELVLDAQLAVVTDPVTAPVAARVGGRVEDWRADLDALQEFHDRWTAWRERWDRLRGLEAPLFQALRRVTVRLATLRADRLETATRAMSGAPGDDVAAFLQAVRAFATRQVATIRQSQARLVTARADLESDPVLQAMVQGGAESEWSQAAEGARGLSTMAREIELLRAVGREATAAREAHRAPAARLAAVLQVSETFGIAWTLRRVDGRLQALTAVEDQGFVIEGLEDAGPVRLRRADARVSARSRTFAGMVAALLSPRSAGAQAFGNTAREQAQDVILSTSQGVAREVEANGLTYGVMIVGGTCLGFACGGPVGAVAGGKAAGMVVIASAGKDILRGAAKGAIRGVTTDPTAIKSVDVTMDVVNVVDAANGLRNAGRAGLTPAFQGFQHHARNAADATAQIEARLQNTANIGSPRDVDRVFRELHHLQNRRQWARAGRHAARAAGGAGWGTWGAEMIDNLDDVAASAPENLSGVRGALYASALERTSRSVQDLLGLRGAIAADEVFTKNTVALAAAEAGTVPGLLSELQRRGHEVVKASSACETAAALRAEIEAAVRKVEQQAAQVTAGTEYARATVAGCRAPEAVRQAVHTYDLARRLHGVTRGELRSLRERQVRLQVLVEEGARGASARVDVRRLLGQIADGAKSAREAAQKARAKADRAAGFWATIESRKPIIVSDIEQLRRNRPDGFDPGPRLDGLLARLAFSEPAVNAHAAQAEAHATEAERLLSIAQAVAAHVAGLPACDGEPAGEEAVARGEAVVQALGPDDVNVGLLQAANTCLARLAPPPAPPPAGTGRALSGAAQSLVADAHEVERQKDIERQREQERIARERAERLRREQDAEQERLRQERLRQEREQQEARERAAREQRAAAEARERAAAAELAARDTERQRQGAQAAAPGPDVLQGFLSGLAAAAAQGQTARGTDPGPGAPPRPTSPPPRSVASVPTPPPSAAPKPPVLAAVPRDQGPHWVLLLTNASNGLYLGPEGSLAQRTRCSFEGGGRGCATTDVVTYRRLLGPFPTRPEAQAALCRSVTERRVFALGIGLKGRWQGSDTWYGLWDGSVRADCHR